VQDRAGITQYDWREDDAFMKSKQARFVGLASSGSLFTQVIDRYFPMQPAGNSRAALSAASSGICAAAQVRCTCLCTRWRQRTITINHTSCCANSLSFVIRQSTIHVAQPISALVTCTGNIMLARDFAIANPHSTWPMAYLPMDDHEPFRSYICASKTCGSGSGTAPLFTIP